MNALNLTAVAVTAALALSACHPHDEHDDHGHDHNHPAETAAVQSDHDHHAHSEHDHNHNHDHAGEGHGAHVHGEGNLTLIQDGNQVMVNLTLPTDSLWGFERAPENTQEEALIKDTLTHLNAGHRFFTLPENADCQPTEVTITPPANLNDPTASGHMELEAQWFWQCEGPVNAITVALFKHFPELHRLTLQRLSESGSGGAELTPSSPDARW
ncbi:DUF2796 domain-containing protein [Ferrimonas balearica]|uniref:ZrgA family zinc uptake protein n=1 Tax=Ferrimonas balearica TaxID=44012 RepID=UPI001C9A16C1|nr:DUF2796 domain-containing protein [Ferrimonas balearica]MBY5921059.1 DUF2796 domain-containing protein [Ferrimonas balearica]MBY5996256.1 DUF2796 domain-containing protein [Ferrimonas balearica]